MEERSWKIGSVEIIIGSSSRVLKIVVVVLLAVSALALGTLAWVEANMKSRTSQMKSEAAQYSYENAQLEDNIADLGTMDSIERIAREELGMVDEDTVIIEAQVK